MPILRDLRVHAFRNLKDQTLELGSGIHIFSGANGQGKTNVLEAVFFLGLLRSFRTSRISHLVQWDCESCAVDGTLADESVAPLKIGVRHGAKRRLIRAGQPVARASDYLGMLHCVPVVPEDLQLIKGSARLRRQYLDVTLAPHDPSCLQALQQFNHALTQRNALLKSQNLDPSALAAFDGILVSAGAEVVRRRGLFITQLSIEYQALLADLPDEGLPIELRYHPGFTTNPSGSLAEIAEAFRASLDRSADRDRRYGQSHVGPQRDDLKIFLDGRPISEVGSEGQCRLAAILLRLAAARVLAREDDPPVVLVDDVIGELDRSRRAYFMDLLGELPQVLLACTDAAELPALDAAVQHTVLNGIVGTH